MAAGNDRVVVFYNPSGGKTVSTFDYSGDEDQNEFTVAETSPGGESVIIGSFDRYRKNQY